MILGLGLSVFVAREVARGAPQGSLLGTATMMAVGMGMVGWILALPVADLIAGGRPVVRTLIVVGFLLLPITITIQTLMGVIWGREQWRIMAFIKLGAPCLVVLVYVLLALGGWFTVTSAAIVLFTAPIVAGAPFYVRLLRTIASWTVERATAVRAAQFGYKTSLGHVALQSNARLDQLVLAATVPLRELGLYVIAVTWATLPLTCVSALNYVILPTVAAGGHHVVKPVLRITLWGTAALSAAMALAAPSVIDLLFSDAFSGSVPMAQILSCGTLFLAGNLVLGAALAGAGRPGDVAIAEGLALGVTIPLLLLLLPSLQATGAAITSVAAYAVSFGFLLHRAHVTFGGSVGDYVLVRRVDVDRLIEVTLRHRAPGRGK